MSNLEKVQELYGAFGRGEIQPVLAALAPDVEWVEGDIEGLPYRGAHHGPEASAETCSRRFRAPTSRSSSSRRSGSTAATRSSCSGVQRFVWTAVSPAKAWPRY